MPTNPADPRRDVSPDALRKSIAAGDEIVSNAGDRIKRVTKEIDRMNQALRKMYIALEQYDVDHPPLPVVPRPKFK